MHLIHLQLSLKNLSCQGFFTFLYNFLKGNITTVKFYFISPACNSI